MEARKKKGARLAALAGAIAASIAFCACEGLFSAGSDETETRVSVSSEVTELLGRAGIQAEGWTLLCYFASGNCMEETSASGAFSVQFPDSDIAAVFAKPAISSSHGRLGESAVPSIGALYPYCASLEGSGAKAGGRLELDFYGGVAAEAARLIFLGAESPKDAARLAGAFNWSKFDAHIRTAKRAVPYPLLVDMEKFLAAFFEGTTSMYWKIRSLETAETKVAVPEKLREAGSGGIIFPYYYPDCDLAPESYGGEGALPETLALDLPDGLWFFLMRGSGKWFAVQARGGSVSASYSSEDL